jgi:hypothetical protein
MSQAVVRGGHRMNGKKPEQMSNMEFAYWAKMEKLVKQGKTDEIGVIAGIVTTSEHFRRFLSPKAKRLRDKQHGLIERQKSMRIAFKKKDDELCKRIDELLEVIKHEDDSHQLMMGLNMGLILAEYIREKQLMKGFKDTPSIDDLALDFVQAWDEGWRPRKG